MNTSELEMWWSSLTIAQKERIAHKALKKAAHGGQFSEEDATYPGCSRWWCSLDAEAQTRIHDHCETHHGYVMSEWNDADPYGD